MSDKMINPSIENIYSLTPLQEGMLFQCLEESSSSEYIVQNEFKISGKVYEGQIRQALELVAAKHAVLRTAVVHEKLTKPRQIVVKDRKIEFVVKDFSDLPNEECLKEYELWKERDVKRNFNLRTDSLMRVALIYLSSDNSRLIFTYHHIIMDGWSLSILYGDFLNYYRRLVEGTSFEALTRMMLDEKRLLPEYGKYVQYLEKKEYSEDLKYWENVLSGYENEACVMPLYPSKGDGNEMAKISITLSGNQCEKLKQLALQCNLTMSQIIETAWAVTLAQYSFTDDVVFGKIVSGRDLDGIPNIQKVLGVFINTVPIRTVISDTVTVKELLENVKKQDLESIEHGHCALVDIQNRTAQKSQLIQTLFVYENYYVDANYSALSENDVVNFEYMGGREQTHYPITVVAKTDDRENIILSILYNSNMYAEKEVEWILARIEKALACFCENVYQKVSGISLHLEEEKELICEFNETEADYGEDQSLASLFHKQALATPDAVAIVSEGYRLTYHELEIVTNRLAEKLRSHGVKKGDFVMIIGEKHVETIVGICGIVKTGAAYVPVDPNYPQERVQFMIQDCKPTAVLVYDSIFCADVPVISLNDVLEGDGKESDYVDMGCSGEDLAYVIYTSGTTGQPKGSLIQNKGVVRLVRNVNYVELNEKTVIMMTGSLAFDASTFEIWGSLLNGGTLVVSNDDVITNSIRFKEYLLKFSVNTMFLTTALFNQMMQIDGTLFNSLKYLMTGGEKISEKHVRIFFENNHTTRLSNVYGPTENTTFTTGYVISRDFDAIYIGKPISNTQVYIMNGDCLCGIGIPGQLCITGDGVALGYLNREEMTEEKFVDNPFGTGKMYLSGDLARWTADGNIDFLDRIDSQIKIRGFRIELSEIEKGLREYVGVEDACVIAKDGSDGEKEIYAYLVSNDTLAVGRVRDFLRERMPEYMVPTYMMQIEKLPLTTQGKIDKKALPDIEKTSGEEYVAPTTNRERKLVKVFEEILNVTNIGINDNFYNLGGDSIKAIRVVAKYRSEGYIISVKDVMTKCIIRQIAKDATEEGAEEKNYNQGQIKGEAVNTPILKDFVRWNMACPEVFVQSVILEIDAIETETVVEGIDMLVQHHDILRANYRNQKLQISDNTDVKAYDFVAYTSNDYLEVDDSMRAKCADAIETIDVEKGPLVKVVYFKGLQKGFLFVCIHHLVVDGVSWRILLEDLGTSLGSLKKHDPVNLPKKTASFIEWSEALDRYSKSDAIQKQQSYWNEVVNQIEAACISQTSETCAEHATSISCSLEKEKTKELLRMAVKAFHTDANELLIAALGVALQKLTGQTDVAVRLEGHGREDIDQDINILRTVGWFTSTYPIIVSCKSETEDTIIATKEMLRHIPNRGIGYGLLFADYDCAEPNLLFNYLGELTENSEQQDGDLHFCEINSQKNERNTAFDGISINCFVEKGILIITVSYKGTKFTKDFIQQLAAAYEESINNIVDFCCKQEKERKTPTDYAKKHLTISELSSIEEMFGNQNIENIYSLTPLQEGMLFAYVNGSDTTSYVVQHVLNIKGSLNAKLVEKAVYLLGVRYEILRAGIFYESEESPALVVRSNSDMEYLEVDFSNADQVVADEKLSKLQKEDVCRGFDLQRDSLLRIKLVLMPQGNYKMVWCFHHIIMDGWCLSFLYNSFWDFYNRLFKGESFEAVCEYARTTQEKSPKYSAFLRWSEEQDYEVGLNYWQDLLEDYNSVADIAPVRKPVDNEEHVGRVTFDLPYNLSQKVASFSADNQSTISCSLETAIGILLMKYNYEKDVVFGKVVSGRDVDVVGADEMVGLFINTIPVRVKATDDWRVKDIVDYVHKQSNESRTYDICPLAEIKRRTQQRELFRILFAYENYYVDKNVGNNLDGTIGFTIENSREQTDYPLTIAAFMDEQSGCIKFIFMYNPGLYAKEDIVDIFERLQCIVEQVVEHSDYNIVNVNVLLEGEKEQIITEFNDTTCDYPRDKTVIQLIEEQATINRDRVAVVYGDNSITYGELVQKIDSLARVLQKKAVNAGDFVAIVAEKSIEMVVGMCAALKVGAAYVPIDMKNPMNRIQSILEDCNPVLALTYKCNFKLNIPAIDLESEELGQQDSFKDVNYSADSIAYVMYTSGTTGKPKGSLVPNRAIVRLVKNTNYIDLNQDTVILQTGSIAFDAATFEIWGVLLNGGKLVLEEQEIVLNPDELKIAIKKHKVNTMWVTAALYNQIIQMDNTTFDDLKNLLVGGEKLSERHIKLLRDRNENITIINGYGPTENTTFTTTYSIPVNFSEIMIGKPISQTKVYITNGENLCGIGIPGELCIAGDGLSTGYLRNQELTNEKFIVNPYGDGMLYRSGDLACWMLDGNIKYLGRIDEQVKVHGYRIELQEISKAIVEQSVITDAVTIVREEADGNKSLNSYFVAEQQIEISSLRSSIAAILPDYMLPKLMQIDAIPINRNGKLDKKALPIIAAEQNECYEAPKDSKEAAVCKVFSDILGIQTVGRKDNFFRLGGDSIKAIRIVSALKRMNYDVTVKLIMSNAVVCDIAEAITTKESSYSQRYEQGEVTGIVEETPIMQEFRNMNLKSPEYFSQNIVLKFSSLNRTILERVLNNLCRHHDILRAVYREGKLEILPFDINCGYELIELEQDDVDYLKKVNDRFDLENGPLFRAVLSHNADDYQVNLCAHHLIVDGVSWRIITEDINLMIHQALEGKNITLPEKTASFIEWSRFMKDYKAKISNEEKQYWNKVVAKIDNSAFKMMTEGSNAQETVHFSIAQVETKQLLKDVGHAFHTEINDILLGALGEAFWKLTGKNCLSILLEGHGREELSKNMETERTVGWFTCMYPVVLSDLSDDHRSVIINTKETLRKIPNHGIGYGYCADDSSRRPEISFNYLGQMETGTSQDADSLGIGGSLADEDSIFDDIKINGSICDEQLCFDFSFYSGYYDKEMISKFAQYYKEAIVNIIDYCTLTDSEKTPSDYSANDLEYDDYQVIVEYVKNFGEIEDIHSLTPLQQDMLLQSVREKESTCYVVQEVFQTQYDFDEKLIRDALHLLALKYDVLKTVFMSNNLLKPRQIVLKDRELKFSLIDLQNCSETDAKEQLENFVVDDVRRGFELDKDPLLRLTYFIMPANERKLIWTYHHIIFDGWCMSLLFREFFAYYKELEDNNSYEQMRNEILESKKHVKDYGDYLRWIQQKDKSQSMKFWSDYLQDYENVAEIKKSSVVEKSDLQVAKHVDEVSELTSEKLKSLAENNCLTISTIFKTAWGIVLQQYNAIDDVVFGEVVSGRNADVSGLDSIIGLCINTIPVRVKGSKKTTIKELLNQVNKQSFDTQSNSFCSLAEIQDSVVQKNNLIKTLCVFENYYVDENAYDIMEDRYKTKLESAREQTDFALNIVGYYDNMEKTIKIVAMYDPNMYCVETIINLTEHIKLTLDYMVNNPTDLIQQIPLASKREEELIINSFNNTIVPYDSNKSMIALFEEQVRLHPMGRALSMFDKTMNYQELNQKANQLAHELVKLGTVKNEAVVVMIPRSFEMIIAVLGVLKVGAIFVPVDTTYPEERIRYILDDCQPKAILVNKGCSIETLIPIVDLDNPEVWTNPNSEVQRVDNPENVAYTIYTSGTTGKPKGVRVKNRGVANMVNYLNRIYEIDESDCVLQFANYVFDAFVWELSVSLLSGAELVLIDMDTIHDIERFNLYVKEKKISITLLPPQYYLQTNIEGLKVLTTGGSASNAEVVKKAANNKKYVNAYGPTENTVLATHWICEENTTTPSNIPIGKPMDNVQAYVIQDSRLCGLEMPGELCIAGDGLAHGYLNNPELTGKAFTLNPFGDGRLYHTGDLVRWLLDGNLEYLGRIDEQVKIRGFRIEKGEVENAFRNIQGIKDVVVIDLDDQMGEKNLYAYLVADEELDIHAVRLDVMKLLPGYMVPAYIIQIDEIPLTKSGKPDKHKLEELFVQVTVTQEDDTRDEYERTLKDIWKELLNTQNLSIYDNFYYRGGNSLKISNMFTQINRKYPGCLSIGDIFANPTIAALAEQIRRNHSVKITLRQMRFPSHYFQFVNAAEEIEMPRELMNDVEQKIVNLYNKEEDELFSALLFAYGYLLCENAESSHILVCGGRNEEFFNFEGEFKEISDLNELKNKLDAQYKASVNCRAFQPQIKVEEFGLIPTLLYNSDCAEKKMDFVDFAINVRVGATRADLGIQIKNTGVNETAVAQLMKMFVMILQQIL